jgi:hypothetical protein
VTAEHPFLGRGAVQGYREPGLTLSLHGVVFAIFGPGLAVLQCSDSLVVQQHGQYCWEPDANNRPIARNGPNDMDV